MVMTLFAGELGKKMMIEQGYVPDTCQLPIELAGPLIWDRVNKGEDVCAGCNMNRSVCHGRARIYDKDERIAAMQITQDHLLTLRGREARDRAFEARQVVKSDVIGWDSPITAEEAKKIK
jgi:hypothetical protein